VRILLEDSVGDWVLLVGTALGLPLGEPLVGGEEGCLDGVLFRGLPLGDSVGLETSSSQSLTDGPVVGSAVVGSAFGLLLGVL